MDENKVISFMDKIDNVDKAALDFRDLRNSPNAKLRCLDKCRADAKDYCIKNVLCDIYKKSIPVSDEYRNAYSLDLDNQFNNFMTNNCGNSATVYITDACKKSPFAKKILEAVENIVNDEYKDKEVNLDKIDPEDLIFKSSDNMEKKLDVLKNDLSVDQISSAIRDNVLNSAVSEINRAKEAKEKLKELEDELVSNPNVTTKESVDNELIIRGFKNKKLFTPTIFQGIMINESKKAENLESIPNLFESMKLFRENNEEKEDTNMDYAFIESVREYTILNVLKALRLESFSNRDIGRIADRYAMGKM